MEAIRARRLGRRFSESRQRDKTDSFETSKGIEILHRSRPTSRHEILMLLVFGKTVDGKSGLIRSTI
jgi:predicted GTPase